MNLRAFPISVAPGFFFTSGQQPMPDRELPCTAPWLFELNPQSVPGWLLDFVILALRRWGAEVFLESIDCSDDSVFQESLSEIQQVAQFKT